MSRRLAGPVEEDVRIALQQKIQASMQQVHGIMQSIQRLAIELRPPILDSLGLAEAIAWEAREFEARSGLSCAIRLPQERPPLHRDQATALFRILQESLTNVMRHAEANRVSISLEEQDAHWVFSITDDGRGITESQASDHQSLGLLGIRERALALGGRGDIRGEPGRGTTVTVRVPVSSPRLEEKALP
jgi:signal transduction histidine kinase